MQKLMLAEALGEGQYANNAKITFLNSMWGDAAFEVHRGWFPTA